MAKTHLAIRYSEEDFSNLEKAALRLQSAGIHVLHTDGTAHHSKVVRFLAKAFADGVLVLDKNELAKLANECVDN